MNALDPEMLFAQIAKDIPSELYSHLYTTGSLAAAYEYKRKLRGQAINTKDAIAPLEAASQDDNAAS